MRLPFFALAVALVLVAGSLESAGAQTRIATLDLKRVFNEYWKKKEAETAFSAQALELERDAKSLVESHKQAKQEAQGMLESANDQAVAPDERDKRRKAAEEKVKQVRQLEDDLAQYDRQARTTLDSERQRIRSRILGEISDVVGAKAKAGGFSLVLNTAPQIDPGTGSTELPLILYRDTQDDLTEAVLTELNATAPANSLNTGQASAVGGGNVITNRVPRRAP